MHRQTSAFFWLFKQIETFHKGYIRKGLHHALATMPKYS